MESEKKWLDLRENSHSLASNYWCHGSYGILLARTHIFRLLPDLPADLLLIDRLLDELDESEETIGHSLCHGELGNRSILLDVHRLIHGREPDDAEKWTLLRKTPESIWRIGMHPSIESLGLFTGLSGIAFGMLRLCDAGVPSILALDIPLHGVD
ncbi:hypothetical protein NLX71_07550 [Paenibacillus sp. MZ04-78.2]|uniref:lanthionine synthetase LanC family protein n=1 Tax=Paenibacillus sp. MZ04-78.2 TaxID=2962034 RepID=UPI0020B67221|nr:lanthionine synthetase LanC family protein [Paenibacillus sp. MZ04-78.2]MCP3773174.1 hypothetical protein [Paenibacillus sp. MZ04-78.2]